MVRSPSRLRPFVRGGGRGVSFSRSCWLLRCLAAPRADLPGRPEAWWVDTGSASSAGPPGCRVGLAAGVFVSAL